MSEVLYRKWRPRRLKEVVGQESVTQTLLRAVANNRVAHAYLFCGPRGTGKTSTARILAKAINCATPQDGEPDDNCDICKAITGGHALDLIEIDAASNRGIDDIRSLRERVSFSPNEAKFKVYIVDEVHMLTKEAFNALLKTLEEPPPHVIFVLATTEVHKIPPTIISRCQRFDFRRLSVDAIVDRLETVCDGENIQAEPQALQLIAKASAGGLRDAINLLEQTNVSYGSPIDEQHVRNLLGLESDEAALSLAGYILTQSTQEGLKLINQVLAQGSDLRQFHRATVENLRIAMLIKSGAGAPSTTSQETTELLRDYASNTSLDKIVHALKSFTKPEMHQESASALPLELALLESSLDPLATMAQNSTGLPNRTRPKPKHSTPSQRERTATAEPTISQSPPKDIDSTPPKTETQQKTPVEKSSSDSRLDTEPSALLENQWLDLLKGLNRQRWGRFNVGALLRGCDQRDVGDGIITFKFRHKTHVERMESELNNPENLKILKDSLAKALGSAYDVRVQAVDEQDGHTQKPRNPRDSNLVRAAQSMGAHVIAEKEDNIEPEIDPPSSGTSETNDEGTAGA